MNLETDWDDTEFEELPETEIMSADYTKAVKLNQHIKAHAQIAQESLYEVCKGLKEMRDNKLYKELDYQNFEEYCEQEVGITYRQAKKYVAIASGFSADEGSRLPSIGTEKLYLLAKLDEPQREEIQQKLNISEASVKELKSEISTLKQNKQQLESQIQELENRPVEVMQSTAELEEIQRLENRIAELENQEQAVSDAEEKRFAEFASNMNQQLVEERQRLKKESQEEIQRANLQRDNAFLEVEKLKKQLAEQKEDSPEMKRFKVRIATLCDSIEQLVKFLCENPDSAFLDKSETVIKGAETSLSEIRKQVQA